MLRKSLPVLAFTIPLSGLAAAQNVQPPTVTTLVGPTCSGTPETYNVSVTLPPLSVSSQIDIFLLFDDTGSFASQVPQVVDVFGRVVALLQAQVPTADIAYGVGRLEDYGGPGASFSGENTVGRPFILNQAILSRSQPGFLDDLQDALNTTAPGFGGDLPETSAGEALFQVATGAGFDGNGNGSRLDSGPAGALQTQTNPGTSGDVPPFSSYVGSSSGSLGGVGWRADSQRIVVLATEVCSVAAFDAGLPIPARIVGTGSTEPTTAFQCPPSGSASRFGFVSDALTVSNNTVTNAVAPLGSATIPQTIAALNGAGIHVIGLGPGVAPTNDPGPANGSSVVLSALARLTGAVDDNGEPLVFDTSGGPAQIAQGIVTAVQSLAGAEVDVTVEPMGLPAGLTAEVVPSIVTGLGTGETANFAVTLTPDPTFDGGMFRLGFRDQLSGSSLGEIPFNLLCSTSGLLLDFETEDDFATPLVNGEAIASFLNFERFVRIDGESASSFSPAAFDTSPTGPNAASSDQDLLVGSGNALILQKNGTSSTFGIYDNPDDHEDGGVYLFSFFRPTTLRSIDLIDIDVTDPLGLTILMSDSMGRARIYTVPGGFTADPALTTAPGIRTLDLTTLEDQPGYLATATANEVGGFDPDSVRRLRIIFRGSGALDNLAFDLNTGSLIVPRRNPNVIGRLPGMPPVKRFSLR